MSNVHQAARALLAEVQQGSTDPAAMALALAPRLAAAPDDDAARLAIASCLWTAGRHRDAVVHFRRLAASNPQDAGILFWLGRSLMQTGALVEGEALLRVVATEFPDHADVQAWWGMALFAQRRHAEALAPLEAALALRPAEKQWHMARAEALLAVGRWHEGWAEHAWRWHGIPPDPRRAPINPLGNVFAKPNPTSWRGRAVLFHAEQGQGDTLQCLRYVAPAIAAGAQVVLEVQPALRRLAAAIPGVSTVVAHGDPLPAHALAVPMFHLPWAFDTAPDTVPAAPYLRADPEAAARWRARLNSIPGRKIGLVWAGEPRPEDPAALATDRRRSIPLAALAPLATLPGVAFVSLQKGIAAEQPWPPGLALHDWATELVDFADTAAIMDGLDLVISVDTAPLHLAGALGRPVWLLNRYDSCWRWLLDRDDSPWYPTLRQFRQASPGDWQGVIARVTAALAEFAQ